MKQYFTVLILCFVVSSLLAQDESNIVYNTFKDTRVINTHSVETVQKRKLDIRIGHRFGDIGDGWESLYGLENATDVLFGGEYGITDRMTVGFGRTKGAGPLKALLSTTLKYKIVQQMKRDGSPFSVTALTIATMSTMKKSDNPEVLHSFEKMSHRMTYGVQLIIGKKFGERLSLQFIPGFIHRNVVPFDDTNDIITAGFAGRFQLTKVIGLIADYTVLFSSTRPADKTFYAPLGIGLEFDTGGHVFQMNFTNATGIMETDYIPNTESNWGDGEFRIGFTISRLFNL